MIGDLARVIFLARTVTRDFAGGSQVSYAELATGYGQINNVVSREEQSELGRAEGREIKLVFPNRPENQGLEAVLPTEKTNLALTISDSESGFDGESYIVTKFYTAGVDKADSDYHFTMQGVRLANVNS